MRTAFIRLVLLLALAVPAAPPAHAVGVNAGTESGVELALPAPREGFTVAILADRTTGFDEGLAVLEQAVAELNLLKPDLVLHIGDLVPGYIRDMDRWEADIARVKAILAELEAPLFTVAGNHDVITGTGDPDDRRGEALYQQHFAPLYYSFDHGGAHFVILYSEESLQSLPRFRRAQIDWLRNDLEATESGQVFVLVHKPAWEYDGANWDEVHAVLREHPVRAVIAGHFHHYYKSVLRDGIRHYVIGVTGGRTFSPELAGGLEHYCLLHVGPGDYTLALVKPGHVLADDYIAGEDFHAMERLRFLSRDQSGAAAPVQSPEAGPVNEQVAVHVTNPLKVALPVTVRGVARGGHWRFRPASRCVTLGPGERRSIYLGVSAPLTEPTDVVAPEVEVQYTFTDSRGRIIPIVLPRRVPLKRAATAPIVKAAISIDGRAEEPGWREAALLPTAVWLSSPYETGERGPLFRVLPTPAGLYFHAESPDVETSEFRGSRMLSDAIFIAAVEATAERCPAPEELPMVVVFPFAPEGPARTMRAFWDLRSPVGPEAPGVHAAARGAPDGGWQCEGFVPWDALLAGGLPPEGDLLFNIGAWDNDGELFTELHSWAPTEPPLWGRLGLEGLPSD